MWVQLRRITKTKCGINRRISWWLQGHEIKLLIYLLTAIGLTPGGRSTVHIDTQTIRRTIQNEQYIEQHNNYRTTQHFWKSAGRAPSWLVIPWHLPYNWGKSTKNLSQGISRNSAGLSPWSLVVTLCITGFNIWNFYSVQTVHSTRFYVSQNKTIFISVDGLWIFLMRCSVFTARYEMNLHNRFRLISSLNTRVLFQVILCEICGRLSGIGNVFLSVLRFSPVSTIPTMLHTDLHLHVVLSQNKRAKQGNFLKGMPFRKSGARKREVFSLFSSSNC